MSRAPLRAVCRIPNGPTVTGATVVVCTQGTSTPVSDLFAAPSGGSAISGAAIASDADGGVLAWLGTARTVTLKVSGGNLSTGGAASYSPLSVDLEVRETPEDESSTSAALAAEVSRAEAAESAEATTRAAADSILLADINNEATRALAAEAALVPSAQKGAANGVATLDGAGKLTGSQLPTLRLDELLAPTGPVSFGGQEATNGAAPTAGSSFATRDYVDGAVGSGGAPDATPTSKGVLQLAGDLAGSASAPTVPGLGLKVDKLAAEVFYARAYGPLVAGSTNPVDVAANSATIDAAAAAAKAAGGGVVALPRGTFYVKRQVILPSNVWLQGSYRGATKLTRVATSKTLLTANAAASATTVTVIDPTIFSVGQGIHLWDSSNWDGWASTTGIVTAIAGNVLTIDTPLWGGLQTARAATATTLHPLVRNEIDATHWGVLGMTLDQNKGANDPPLANVSYTAAVVHLERAFNGLVADCEVANAAGDAISDQGWDGANAASIDGTNNKRTHNTYRGNDIHDAVRHGIHIGTGTEGTFTTANQITSCGGGYGVYFCAYACHGVHVGNIIRDCLSGFAGLDGRDFGNLIVGNQILDCRAGGYAVEAGNGTLPPVVPGGGCVVSGNFIRGRAMLLAVPDYRVVDNIIDLNQVGSIPWEVRAGAGGTLIEGNKVRNGGAGTYGLYLLAGANDVSFNNNDVQGVNQGATINGVQRFTARNNRFSSIGTNVGWSFEGTVNTDCQVQDAENALTNPIINDGACVRLTYGGVGDNKTLDPASGGDWNAVSGRRYDGQVVGWNSGGGQKYSIFKSGVGWTVLN